MAQIFNSHSQRDTEIKAFFERIFGRTNVRGLWVEYERYQAPAWSWIRQQIQNSVALFVLLGPHVDALRHTLAWIGTETGSAPPGIEVWVFEHVEYPCEVPMPNVQHYVTYDFSTESQEYVRAVIESLDDTPRLKAGATVAGIGGLAKGIQGAVVGFLIGAVLAELGKYRPTGVPIQCPNSSCHAAFRLHSGLLVVPCPVCRQKMTLER